MGNGSHQKQSLLFFEWNWCRGCKYCWMYATQEPCSKCLDNPIGLNGPLYYEKEISDD